MPDFGQPPWGTCCRLSALIILLVFWSDATLAGAQGERISSRIEPERRELVDRLLRQQVGQQPRRPRITIQMLTDQANQRSDEEVESAIFGRFGSRQNAHQVLQLCLDLELNDLDRACHLTSVQKAKLRLLGKGDIKHYFARYEEMKTRSLQFNLPSFRTIQESVSLRLSLESGLFNQQSLLFKGLRSTLSPDQIEQRDRYRESVRQAAFDQIVARISTWETVRDDQRQAFAKVFFAKTHMPANAGSYDRYLYLMQLERLPKQTLKTALSEVQIMALNAQISEAGSMQSQMIYLGYFSDLAPFPSAW